MTYEIPLFPLNTVLFPGAPLRLHIFEARYKQMINWCIEEQQPFGVVLIRRGQEALGPLAEPYEVGCSAQIVQVERLQQDRMNILLIGQKRFRIHSLDAQSQPYLVGAIENAPLQDPGTQIIQVGAEYLYQQVDSYIQRLVQAGQVEVAIPRLPGQPDSLAYLGAAILQISSLQKQALLDLDHLEELLFELQDIYRRELALLDVLLEGSPAQSQGPFSSN